MKLFITSILLFFSVFSYTQVINIDSVKIYLTELINQHRIEKGVSTLSYNNNLELSAQKHTDYMFVENVISHDEFNKENPHYVGLDPWDRGCIDEICFKGTIQYSSNKNVAITMFRAWCKSPAHYSAIINKTHKSLGIGFTSTEPSNSLKLFIALSTITFN